MFVSYDKSTFAIVLMPGTSIVDWTLTPKERWHLERHMARWEARYGMKYPTFTGEIGRYEGTRIVKVGAQAVTTHQVRQMLCSEVCDPKEFGSTLKPWMNRNHQGMPWYRHRQRW